MQVEKSVTKLLKLLKILKHTLKTEKSQKSKKITAKTKNHECVCFKNKQNLYNILTLQQLKPVNNLYLQPLPRKSLPLVGRQGYALAHSAHPGNKK